MKRFPVLFLLILSASSLAGALTVSEVARELSCRCGCNMTVDGCNHTNCPFAIPARKSIDEKIASGMTKEGIMQSFVAQYGEVVLAAPTKKGFNLTAWILPFVMILVGGGIVRVVIKRWTKPGARSDPGRSSPAEDAEYQARVEKELKDLDR
ncbi:MAG: cytochrome c-type biogenesis protein CcmH [Candidatus Latescibacteria bacterium]|nr:cytochrome c-type biogenesis protein CcmH [Candidatus Latescibacterota bacterium]